jgi:hypothetical protein
VHRKFRSAVRSDFGAELQVREADAHRRALSGAAEVADGDGSDSNSCALKWGANSDGSLAVALELRNCSSVVLELSDDWALVDTTQLPSAMPLKVTIVGQRLADGRLPKVLVRNITLCCSFLMAFQAPASLFGVSSLKARLAHILNRVLN